jgi:hypothetical protein
VTTVRAYASLALVVSAALLGIVGTGLLYTAVADQKAGALIWGLPLSLFGLYWCGRALARSQRYAQEQRVRHRIELQGNAVKGDAKEIQGMSGS